MELKKKPTKQFQMTAELFVSTSTSLNVKFKKENPRTKTLLKPAFCPSTSKI